MRIVLAHAAVADMPNGPPDVCYPHTVTQPADQALVGVNLPGGLTVATVRISVRAHFGAGDGGNFVCDRVLNVPRDNPSLRIPKTSANSIDIWAEAFAPLQSGDAAPRRVAVGALLAVPFTAKTLPDLRLYPDERFRCVNQKMSRPRAFHTATALPNGQVLILGGLTPSVDGASDSFGAAPLFVAGDNEVYDPVKGTFTKLNDTGMPVPRAFHHASYIGATSDGKYQLLVVGGAAPPNNDATQPAFDINTGAAPGTRIVPFDTSQTLINPLADAGAPAELVTYDPATSTLDHAPFAGFTPAAFQAGAALDNGGVVVAGGVDWKGMPLSATSPAVKRGEVSRNMETPPRGAALVAARMGATLTPLGDDSALLWSGQITPTDPAGELLTGLGAGHTVKATAITVAGAPATEFHTATLLPADPSNPGVHQLLVTGGFLATTMNMGQALQPPSAQSARVVSVSATNAVTQSLPMLSTYAYDPTCMSPTRYRPAAWESAVDVGQGRVLVTGGAPTVSAACTQDCDGGNDFRCATAQASIFASNTLAPTHFNAADGTLERMQVARYGHTSTLLPDGNVLIVGGVTAQGGNPRVLGDAEVYNPRPIVPSFDSASTRPDPDDPIAADLVALGMTRAPGQAVSVRTLCNEL